MSNYIPWYGKKREKLARREADLVRLLRRGGGAGEVERLAEGVRAARIRALKAEHAQLRPCDGPHVAEFAKIDEKIARCLSMSVRSIVEEFRGRLPEA